MSHVFRKIVTTELIQLQIIVHLLHCLLFYKIQFVNYQQTLLAVIIFTDL